LSTAQVIHNQLTSPNGWELDFVRDGNKTIVAQTVKVQDIESYTLRDRGRPKRDTRVGMLPPKLAQIIINLAVGKLPEDKLESICEIPLGKAVPRPRLGKTILDPFCGTGVLLQEAALMGYHTYGTDVEPRMVAFSEANLDWLDKQFTFEDLESRLEPGDATKHQWSPTPDFVAAEGYLGRPFTALPNPEMLARTVADCNLIAKKFLQNIAKQIPSGTRLCVALPAWQIKPNQFKQLPLIDQIEDLGYNQVSFAHTGAEELLYYRADQVVARKLLVITRN
jgi:tRNA (guanine10-N2)-dimethyltransferase